MAKPRLLRITTVPISLHLLLRGQMAYMASQGYDVYTMSADGPEVNDVKREEGSVHVVVPFTRKITPLQDLYCLVKTIYWILKIKPLIVHTHTPKAGLIGMIAARICGVKVRLHTVAGLPLMEASGIKRKILLLTERLTYRCAKKVLVNSRRLEHFIRHEFDLTDGKLEVIGKGSSNGINITTFTRTESIQEEAAAIRKKFGIDDSDIVFSFVGRIVRDKGVGELTRAFKSIRDGYTAHNVFLLLIGSFEDDLDPLDAQDREFLRSDKQVILAGFQKDVKPWLVASDVFVFPSYREGFPNVVMQASALEVPTIVSDINGCNEIIQHGETGIVVPAKNVDALVTAMEEMLADPIKRTKRARGAATYVKTYYDQQYVWSELLKLYQRMTSAH